MPAPGGGRAARALTGFAVGRAIEAAGLSVLRQRLAELADDAEARGRRVVTRDAVETVARDGLGAAVASKLTLGWTAARLFALGVAGLLLGSLPVAIAAFG